MIDNRIKLDKVHTVKLIKPTRPYGKNIIEIQKKEHIFFIEYKKETENSYENYVSNKKNEKIFVYAVYKRIGTGKNLEYNIEKSIDVNDNIDKKILKKDFDAIFLEKPTKIMVRSPKSTEEKLKGIFKKNQTELFNKGWNSLFFNNHDLPRLISRYGDENYREITGKQWAMILHCMQGTPFIYQGEELGMTNRNWTHEEIRDVEAINYYNQAIKTHDESYVLDKINKISRDNARTPMQWNDKIYGGFSEKEPWIIVNENYKEINVENSLNNKNSLLYTYKELINLRKTEEIFEKGNFELLDFGKDFFAYKRVYNNTELYLISNLTSDEKDLNLEISGELIMSNYDSNNNYKAYETRIYLNKI